MANNKAKIPTFLCSTFLFITFFENSLAQETSPYSYNSYGIVGLIETPTARTAADGQLAFGISTEAPYNRLYGRVQFFPWLEGVIRYTEGKYKAYNPGSPQTWKDKGIDLKVRLFQEGDIMPAVAIGLSDFGGTGAYASEYIVANKRLSNFDFTLGMGFGSLGERAHIKNPFGSLDDRFKTRGGYNTYGGKLGFNRLFTGENAAFFGGVEYFTPIPNLSLKLEYDSSLYSDAVGYNFHYNKPSKNIEIESPINFALNYGYNTSKRDQVLFTLGFVRGNTIMAQVGVHSNLNDLGLIRRVMGAEELKEPTLEPFLSLNEEWQKYLVDTTIWQMGNAGYVVHSLTFNDNEIQAEISQSAYRDPLFSLDLASRIIANNAPVNIDTITIVNLDMGIESIRSSISREALTESVRRGPLDEKLLEFNKVTPLSLNAITKKNEYMYPHFGWSINPHMTGTLQHQVQFYFWQLEALISTNIAIKPGLYINTVYGLNIDNNYENYSWHIPDGSLHHVRQDRRLYLTEGESGLRKMSMEYLVNINSNLKAMFEIGYLEWMYGGVGGEILYTPDNKHWALGIDAYWVKQRDFDQKFGFQDYETITGFLSFYYDLPFYDLRFKTSVGRFLGQDKGMDVDVSRRFQTGARVGARVALTDCDASCVGEGSFNKWIYFQLPMDLFYQKAGTRGRAGYSWAPLTKDAGQKVAAGGLYYLVTNTHEEFDSLRKEQWDIGSEKQSESKTWTLKKIMSGFSMTPKD